MGEHNVKIPDAKKTRSVFIEHLIKDIKALEYMLQHDLIEKDIVRIGAEQEFCLIDSNWRPAVNSGAILEAINDDHFTTELARYNLEINLDPIPLKDDCFQQMAHQLQTLLSLARKKAEALDSKVVLTGILPTITQTELAFEFMTPNARYWALNEQLKSIKGTDFRLHLMGVDELSISHDSVLYEACNTSFQLHLQIPPEDFVASYNWAQAISGPILAIATNSPMLLGRELWSETRIALFKQSIDTRRASRALKDQQPRVKFGDKWISGSIAEIFKDDIAQHKIILSKDIPADSLSELKNDRIPKLHALNLHNSTVYRWNRPCYGVGNGKAHVRIENRYIPAGPTTIDEMANFALWVGLMMGRPAEFDFMPDVMDFRDAKSNFIKAARIGKDALLKWRDEQRTVQDLILNELLPLAHAGLKKAGVSPKDRKHLLGIIEARTTGQTGSEWQIINYRRLKRTISSDNALRLVTRAIHKNQLTNMPVHLWPPIPKDGYLKEKSHLVGQIMSTMLFTVNENDLANLATQMMQWKEIHHMPVENSRGKLAGLLTWTHAQKFEAQQEQNSNLVVSDIMTTDVITVHPDTHILDAIKTMKNNEIGCLPVVMDGDLVGIVTIKDVIPFDNE